VLQPTIQLATWLGMFAVAGAFGWLLGGRLRRRSHR